MSFQVAETEAVSTLDNLRSQLAAQEVALLATMKDREHARLRAHAYVLIRQILRCGPDRAWISYCDDGRPVVRGLPPGQHMDVSISHKGLRVVVGVSKSTHRIGVDVEHLLEPIDVQAFARFAVGAGERMEIERLCGRGWTKQGALIAFWSAKESYCKCAGYPLRPLDLAVHAESDMDALTVEPSPGLESFLKVRGLEALPTRLTWQCGWVRAATVMKKCGTAQLNHVAPSIVPPFN